MVEETKSAARMINEVFLNKEVITDEKINLHSGLFESKVKPSADSEKVVLQTPMYPHTEGHPSASVVLLEWWTTLFPHMVWVLQLPSSSTFDCSGCG